MKILSIFIIIVLAYSCKPNHLFKDLENKEVVNITLNKYGLDSIPKEIGKLKEARELRIFRDSMQGWSIYPPISAMEQRIDSPPFATLPRELLTLKKLKKLTIYGLDIQTLPENFYHLENLEYLDLSMNKLSITKEISKLKKLKKLKYLELVGNQIDKSEIEEWQKENPNIEIKYRVK